MNRHHYREEIRRLAAAATEIRDVSTILSDAKDSGGGFSDVIGLAMDVTYLLLAAELIDRTLPKDQGDSQSLYQ